MKTRAVWVVACLSAIVVSKPPTENRKIMLKICDVKREKYIPSSKPGIAPMIGVACAATPSSSYAKVPRPGP